MRCGGCTGKSDSCGSDTGKIKDVLKTLEDNILTETFIRNISGSFAIAKISGCDDKHFSVELRWGVQSDILNGTHIERYKVDRATFEVSHIS